MVVVMRIRRRGGARGGVQLTPNQDGMSVDVCNLGGGGGGAAVP